jgi:hypothetical protein
MPSDTGAAHRESEHEPLQNLVLCCQYNRRESSGAERSPATRGAGAAGSASRREGNDVVQLSRATLEETTHVAGRLSYAMFVLD